MESSEIQVNVIGREKPISLLDAAKATFYTFRMYYKNKPNFPQEAMIQLAGLKLAFPDQLSDERLRNHPNLDFFKQVAFLAVRINDAIDLIPDYRKKDKQDFAEEIYSEWKQAIRRANEEKKGIPEREMIVRDSQRETLALEKYVRKMPEEDWSLGRAVRYREIMNAIAITYETAALLGANQLPGRLTSIDKEHLSWEALEQKYGWMINGKPQNETERKLCGLFNITMGVQVIDDWYGLQDDQNRGLLTIVTKIMKSVGKDKIKAKAVSQEITEKYLKRATQFGFSSSLTKPVPMVARLMGEAMKAFPNVLGGQREKLTLRGG